MTIIGNELVLLKNETDELYKKRFLIKIYERDDEEFSEMIKSVRSVYTAGHKKEARILEKKIVELTSTRTATVKQFTEYLKDILQDSANSGIILPYPDDKNLFCEAGK
jgi:hypothetical protein